MGLILELALFYTGSPKLFYEALARSYIQALFLIQEVWHQGVGYSLVTNASSSLSLIRLAPLRVIYKGFIAVGSDF